MCGIIGYAGLCNISNSVLIEGLEALEYRGYDSAGVAVVHDGEVQVVKAKPLPDPFAAAPVPGTSSADLAEVAPSVLSEAAPETCICLLYTSYAPELLAG